MIAARRSGTDRLQRLQHFARGGILGLRGGIATSLIVSSVTIELSPCLLPLRIWSTKMCA